MVRVWSLQNARIARDQIVAQPTYAAGWEHVVGSAWRRAYDWMAQQMEARGFALRGAAPIWGWLRGADGAMPPTLEDARALLSDMDLDAGVATLVLDVPTSMVLPSLYGRFCEAIDFAHDHPGRDIGAEFESMFELSEDDWSDHSVQCTLPRVERSWVSEVKPLPLKPGDFSYQSDQPL